MKIIGIDPGLSGAIAVLENNKVLNIFDMPVMSEGKKNKRQLNSAHLVNLIKENIIKAYPNIDSKDLKKIINGMWGNYGRILSEYVFMNNFRNSKLSDNIKIKGQEILDRIKNENKPVIFISGHFNNFELISAPSLNASVDLWLTF